MVHRRIRERSLAQRRAHFCFGYHGTAAITAGHRFPYRDLELVDAYLELFKSFMHDTQGVRRPGSAAYDLCLVASGRCDGFFEYGLSAWDVAAGSLLIREAGGVVSDWHGKENWLFGKRIVAGNSDIYQFMKQRIQEIIPEKFLS